MHVLSGSFDMGTNTILFYSLKCVTDTDLGNRRLFHCIITGFSVCRIQNTFLIYLTTIGQNQQLLAAGHTFTQPLIHGTS